MTVDSAIVDIGASNVEEFIRQSTHFNAPPSFGLHRSRVQGVHIILHKYAEPRSSEPFAIDLRRAHRSKGVLFWKLFTPVTEDFLAKFIPND
jgi:hypothetical protein